MSSDRRTPHTDALDTLGSIITENEKRDAIHLAVEPAVAGQRLSPAADVGFLPDGTIGLCSPDNCVGIVDPFLPQPVNKGQRFWLVVYPRQITSLRHVWTHPKFPEAVEVAEHVEPEPAVPNAVRKSIEWITDYSGELGFSYDEMIQGARRYLDHSAWLVGGDSMEGNWTSDEFWDHFEIVTGVRVPEDDRGNFFSCSC